MEVYRQINLNQDVCHNREIFFHLDKYLLRVLLLLNGERVLEHASVLNLLQR